MRLRTTAGILLATALIGVAAGSAWAGLHHESVPSTSGEVVAPATPTPSARPLTPKPVRAPLPTATPTIAPAPLLAPGDESAAVRELQARLRQIDWLTGDVDDVYGPATEEAVRGFQAKRGLPVTGEVDRATMDRLLGMTTEPTADELANKAPVLGISTDAPLDPRCLTGRVLCVDKASRTLRWVVDGEVRLTVETRFGGPGLETREGVFSVFQKSRDHVSSLYDTSMPFAMFFSGGQAVHYSPDFASVGYAGASHGCVNVRDYAAIAWLFDQVQIGDKVVVAWM